MSVISYCSVFFTWSLIWNLSELFPQLVEYLKEDLAKEQLTSKTETRRLELIRSVEKAFQDSAAKKINAKYERT